MMLNVLTGDIVNSSALSASALNGVMKTIAAARTDISLWVYPAYASFARREGDGWQIAVQGPPLGLRAALHLRAMLRAGHEDVETRIALARGEGTLPTQGDLNAASGPAFTASGRLLADLKDPIRMGDAAGGAADAAAILADAISQDWTRAQARALARMLHPKPGPRKDAAQTLGISRQAVDQALHGAGYPALLAALKSLEQETTE